MPPDILGDPHSIQRYVVFGLIGGAMAGGLAAALALPLLPFAYVAGAVTGWLGGVDMGRGSPPRPTTY